MAVVLPVQRNRNDDEYDANRPQINIARVFVWLQQALCCCLEPPGAPRNLRATDITTTSISIGWEPPEYDVTRDVTQYNIDMREEQEAEYSSVAKVSNRITSYTVEDLHRGRLYRFRVRAKNAAGFSDEAAELDAPVQLKALGTFEFHFSWVRQHG